MTKVSYAGEGGGFFYLYWRVSLRKPSFPPYCALAGAGVWQNTTFKKNKTFSLPGANSHFVWVMDVWTAAATVTLAKAVVVHAVLPLLLLLTSVSDYGETPLDCTACFGKQTNHRYPQMNNKQLVVIKDMPGLVFHISPLWGAPGKGIHQMLILILKDYFWLYRV